MVGPAAKREAVAYLREHFQMSERRACSVLAADRKMIRYTSRRPPETELRGNLRDLANQRRRFTNESSARDPELTLDLNP